MNSSQDWYQYDHANLQSKHGKAKNRLPRKGLVAMIAIVALTAASVMTIPIIIRERCRAVR